ncbi:TIGR03668 family PPOX class F420-dependent oxidoreductase [Actinacidiphila soli]|jgi:PPOX class probable F420-dependent enzyme|uniref:TIGR03668 family PPOX class F420-dependent oxidoreductase n=1 Tax=Actinacidiphila soli TaxID=2487275 RepID=UPI000FCB91CC|nr:TIGR03668 family PPOX class F420-dependent oxidoreductase [Actinacidiphila soli]
MPDMAEDEARQRFADARVARLATVDAGGRPHLVPLVFAVRDDLVVSAVDHKPKRSPRLKRLHNIATNPAVCLLADAYDDDWDRLWWARADGFARLATPQEARDAVALLRERYEPYRRWPPDGPVMLVVVRRWRGWRAV